MEGDTASIFNKDWWYGRIMDWSMKNENFRFRCSALSMFFPI
jgi:RHH-type transcriptional regulator, proline utilization regulon repressor / proline dehydrogenase / delta 1-pyrroline-5-carboxylate dehydrogenase